MIKKIKKFVIDFKIVVILIFLSMLVDIAMSQSISYAKSILTALGYIIPLISGFCIAKYKLSFIKYISYIFGFNILLGVAVRFFYNILIDFNLYKSVNIFYILIGWVIFYIVFVLFGYVGYILTKKSMKKLNT